jgi:pyruvate dehydrogenase E1 component
VTSWTELRREALLAEAWNDLHPDEPARVPYVAQRLRGRGRSTVAVSDWMRAVPDQVAPFVEGDWSSLGTDGFGMSDTRATLRRHFRVDAPSIVLTVLERLAAQGRVDARLPSRAITAYGLSAAEDAELDG